jgi:hypothetical protein
MKHGNHGRPVEVFFSYAHEDERIRKRMERHLAVLIRQGLVSARHDRMIGPGGEWAEWIDEHVN